MVFSDDDVEIYLFSDLETDGFDPEQHSQHSQLFFITF